MSGIVPRRVRPILGWLVLFSIFLVWRAPAKVVSPWLERACENRCRLTQPGGSLWQGDGQLQWRTTPLGPWQHVGPLQWRWQLDAPVSPVLRLALGGGEIVLRPGWHALRLEAIAIGVSADLVLDAFAVHAGGGLGSRFWQGTVELEHGAIDMFWMFVRTRSPETGAGTALSGSITMNWRGAGISLLPGLTLGDYRLQATSQAQGHWLARIGPAAAQSSTDAGHLDIAGQAALSPAGELTVDLHAQPRTPADPQLLRLLDGFARRVANPPGAYRWAWPAARYAAAAGHP